MGNDKIHLVIILFEHSRERIMPQINILLQQRYILNQLIIPEEVLHRISSMMVIIIEMRIQQYKKLFFRERERKKIKHVVLNIHVRKGNYARRVFLILIYQCANHNNFIKLYMIN